MKLRLPMSCFTSISYWWMKRRRNCWSLSVYWDRFGVCQRRRMGKGWVLCDEGLWENLYLSDQNDRRHVAGIEHRLSLRRLYAKVDDLETSDTLLNYVLAICSDNHLTYYLSRAAQLTENAIREQQPKETILEMLHDARAYAKINKNVKLLAHLKAVDGKRSIKNIFSTKSFVAQCW